MTLNYFKFEFPLQIEVFDRIFDFSWDTNEIKSTASVYYPAIFIGKVDYEEEKFFMVQFGKFRAVVGKI